MSRIKPREPMDFLRVDPTTATREELVAEVERLNEVCQRWADSWHTIVEANASAWIETVNAQKERITMLEGLI